MPKPENIEPYKMKPGETLNPNGRPKTFKGLTATLRDIVQADGSMIVGEVIEIDENGQETGNKFARAKIKIPKKDMIILAALKKAGKGDMRAVEWLFDRMEGKAKQQIEVESNQPVFKMIDVRDSKKPG